MFGTPKKEAETGFVRVFSTKAPGMPKPKMGPVRTSAAFEEKDSDRRLSFNSVSPGIT